MPNEHNPETGPIEDESSVTRQALVVAMMQLDEVVQTVKSPTSTFLYDVACDKSTHLQALEEVMANLQDAYEALEVCELDNADNNRAWANNLLPQISTLNCGHAPTRCYTEMWEDETIDVVAECLKCSYSVAFPLSHFHHDGN
jgi:Zn ribbon nucleic-acid-binding protein